MHCVQAVFRSPFYYFFDERLDWKEIDKIMKTVLREGAWIIAGHLVLMEKGVEIFWIEPFDCLAFYKMMLRI